jgi:hypothetical protein
MYFFYQPSSEVKEVYLLRGFNKGIRRHPYGAGTIGATGDHSHCVTVAYVIGLTSGEG